MKNNFLFGSVQSGFFSVLMFALLLTQANKAQAYDLFEFFDQANKHFSPGDEESKDAQLQANTKSKNKTTSGWVSRELLELYGINPDEAKQNTSSNGDVRGDDDKADDGVISVRLRTKKDDKPTDQASSDTNSQDNIIKVKPATETHTVPPEVVEKEIKDRENHIKDYVKPRLGILEPEERKQMVELKKIDWQEILDKYYRKYKEYDHSKAGFEVSKVPSQAKGMFSLFADGSSAASANKLPFPYKYIDVKQFEIVWRPIKENIYTSWSNPDRQSAINFNLNFATVFNFPSETRTYGSIAEAKNDILDLCRATSINCNANLKQAIFNSVGAINEGVKKVLVQDDLRNEKENLENPSFEPVFTFFADLFQEVANLVGYKKTSKDPGDVEPTTPSPFSECEDNVVPEESDPKARIVLQSANPSCGYLVTREAKVNFLNIKKILGPNPIIEKHSAFVPLLPTTGKKITYTGFVKDIKMANKFDINKVYSAEEVATWLPGESVVYESSGSFLVVLGTGIDGKAKGTVVRMEGVDKKKITNIGDSKVLVDIVEIENISKSYNLGANGAMSIAAASLIDTDKLKKTYLYDLSDEAARIAYNYMVRGVYIDTQHLAATRENLSVLNVESELSNLYSMPFESWKLFFGLPIGLPIFGYTLSWGLQHEDGFRHYFPLGITTEFHRDYFNKETTELAFGFTHKKTQDVFFSGIEIMEPEEGGPDDKVGNTRLKNWMEHLNINTSKMKNPTAWNELLTVNDLN